MILLLAALAVAGSLAVSPAAAQTAPEASTARRIEATRTDSPPDVDGRLDDPVWRTAARITRFVQQRPLDGAPATEQTEVLVAYDSQNLYFGIYAHYNDPSIIRANRVDRDQTGRDDTVSLYFDPFLDRQRAYVFSVNGYGVQGDALMGGGGGGEAADGAAGGAALTGIRPGTPSSRRPADSSRTAGRRRSRFRSRACDTRRRGPARRTAGAFR